MKKLVLLLAFCGLVFGSESALNSSNSQSSAVPKITNINFGAPKDINGTGCETELSNDVFSGGVKMCAVDENETNATSEGNLTANLENNATEILHQSNSGVTQGKNGGVKLPFD